MNPEELKNAVREVRGGRKQVTWDAESAEEYNDALNLVLDTCETVLAVGAKMPQKINHNHGGACGSGNFCPPSYAEAEAYNKAIDACTIAFASMLDREKLYAILGKSVEFDEDGNAWTNHTKAVDAILSAMKGGQS